MRDGPGGRGSPVDLSKLKADRLSGRATRLEVSQAAALDPTAEMRRAIAAAMSRAKREIPHYYLGHEIDLQTAQDWLTALNAGRTAGRDGC